LTHLEFCAIAVADPHPSPFLISHTSNTQSFLYSPRL
jgi:hypothetical protein